MNCGSRNNNPAPILLCSSKRTLLLTQSIACIREVRVPNRHIPLWAKRFATEHLAKLVLGSSLANRIKFKRSGLNKFIWGDFFESSSKKKSLV